MSIHAYLRLQMKNVNSDIAYDYIRKRILDGTYLSGHPLMTKDLAAEIGVSRTPVRDALRQLEADGLVVIRAHLGASVKTMTFKEFKEMCGLRLALESYAAGLAAENRSADELDEMYLALTAMRALTTRHLAAPEKDQATIEELKREDVRFHIAIIGAAQNQLLKKEVLRLHIVSRVVTTGVVTHDGYLTYDKSADDAHRREVQQHHDDIYAAIKAGDAAQAKAVMALHIQDIIDTKIKQMAYAEEVKVAKELTEDELLYTL
jgi:DNA-binding GntR family transcriptional regulator